MGMNAQGFGRGNGGVASSFADRRLAATGAGAVLGALVVLTLAASAHGAIYWADDRGNIGRADNDGTNVDPTFVDSSVTDMATCGVGVAPGVVFWGGAGDDGSQVGQVQANGTGVNPSWVGPFGDDASICGVAGQANGGAFWARTSGATEPSQGAIGSANANGQNLREQLVSNINGACGPATDGQYVYWGDSPGNIGRATTAGASPNLSFIPNNGTQLTCGVSAAGGSLYWTTWGGSLAKASAAGGSVNRQFIDAGIDPGGTAVRGNYIYWTDYNGIGRAQLDGSQVQPNFITGISPYGPPAIDGTNPPPVESPARLDSDVPAAAADAPLAKARAVSQDVRVDVGAQRKRAYGNAPRKGTARVRVACRSQVRRCGGSVGIRARIRDKLRSVAAPRIYLVRAGKEVAVDVRLRRAARRALRRKGELTARIGVTTRQPADIGAFAGRRVKLLAR